MRIACLAQIVNVIAPLMTNERRCCARPSSTPTRGPCSTRAGRVLDLAVESETYAIAAEGLRPDFARDDQVPFVDVTVTFDPTDGHACVLMLNRDTDAERELTLEWRDPTPTRVVVCETLTGPDVKAFNTFEQPQLVVPRPLEPPPAGARMTFKLPARSLQRGAYRHDVRTGPARKAPERATHADATHAEMGTSRAGREW